jgi:hypothetical protein
MTAREMPQMGPQSELLHSVTKAHDLLWDSVNSAVKRAYAALSNEAADRQAILEDLLVVLDDALDG